MNMAYIGNGRMGRSDMTACLLQGMLANARVVAVGDDEANRLLDYPHRQPWVMGV